jgi:hypothetical protein
MQDNNQLSNISSTNKINQTIPVIQDNVPSQSVERNDKEINKQKEQILKEIKEESDLSKKTAAYYQFEILNAIRNDIAHDFFISSEILINMLRDVDVASKKSTFEDLKNKTWFSNSQEAKEFYDKNKRNKTLKEREKDSTEVLKNQLKILEFSESCKTEMWLNKNLLEKNGVLHQVRNLCTHNFFALLSQKNIDILNDAKISSREQA